MIILAGFPAITTLFSNDFVTTLPAPTTTLSPNTTPGKIVTPPPSQTLFPIWIGAPYSNPEFLSIGSRGGVDSLGQTYSYRQYEFHKHLRKFG